MQSFRCVIDPGSWTFRNKTKHSQAMLYGATGRHLQDGLFYALIALIMCRS